MVKTTKRGAREDKDHGDRAETEADGKRDASASKETWCDAGGRSREEDGVRLGSEACYIVNR
jgi:hypothetical protein